jgi:hypothetical protein
MHAPKAVVRHSFRSSVQQVTPKVVAKAIRTDQDLLVDRMHLRRGRTSE